MFWVGLDLHKKYITACALDGAGSVVAEHRRLPADAEAHAAAERAGDAAAPPTRSPLICRPLGATGGPMTRADLLARLKSPEDSLVERKPANPKAADLRATACGFANAVPPGATGIIFLGVAPDGTILGVPDPDSLQRTVRSRLAQECYPSIDHQCTVLEDDGKFVVAVEIPASAHRPHFTGAAYVRKGSETVAATKEQYEQLIASRNTVAGVLSRAIGETWLVIGIGKRIGDTKPIQQPGHRELLECRIVDVNAHYVRLHNASSGTNLTEELTHAEISYDEKRYKPLLIVRGT